MLKLKQSYMRWTRPWTFCPSCCSQESKRRHLFHLFLSSFEGQWWDPPSHNLHMGFLLGVLLYESSMGMEVPSLGIPIKSTNLRAQGQNLRESWDIYLECWTTQTHERGVSQFTADLNTDQPVGCGMQVSSNNACHVCVKFSSSSNNLFTGQLNYQACDPELST